MNGQVRAEINNGVQTLKMKHCQEVWGGEPPHSSMQPAATVLEMMKGNQRGLTVLLSAICVFYPSDHSPENVFALTVAEETLSLQSWRHHSECLLHLCYHSLRDTFELRDAEKLGW